jgi:hypothetical protein
MGISLMEMKYNYGAADEFVSLTTFISEILKH